MTLISTILSLAFILLSYFGITRYLSLHFKSPEIFIKSYNQLPQANKKRVIICFACSKQNLYKLKPLINSILDQTVKVDQIGIVIPDNINTVKIPKYITDVANVFPVGKNYGKCNNLIPVLLREKESDTIIIAIDTDKIYGKDFVESIIDLSEKDPDTTLVDKKDSFILTKPQNHGCDVIDRQKKYFDTNWLIAKTKKSKIIEYTENYKILF